MKSAPVTVKGGRSCVLSFGSGAGSGVAYDLPHCFLQMVHQHNKVLMYLLAGWYPVGLAGVNHSAVDTFIVQLVMK